MIIGHYKQCSLELIGKDHVQSGLPCQDKTAFAMKDGVRVIALADGAGSKKDSHLGAEITTNIVVKMLANNFDDYFTLLEDEPDRANVLGKEIIKEVYKGLNKKVTDNQAISIIEMSCTLLFVAQKGDKYIQGHIGDGLIGELITNESGMEVRIRSHPENNGAPNITFFITDSDANDNFRITSGFMPSNVKGIVLMSDGPEEVLFDPIKKTINQYIQNLFKMYKGNSFDEYYQILLRFLQEKVSEYSYDDLSMNFLYLENEPIEYYQKQGTAYMEYLKSKLTKGARVLQKAQYSYMIDDSVNDTTSSLPRKTITRALNGSR